MVQPHQAQQESDRNNSERGHPDHNLDLAHIFLKFSPDVAELVESLFRRQPFGGAYGAFCVSSARLGVVAQIDSIPRGIEDTLVHPDRVTFTKGNDLKF